MQLLRVTVKPNSNGKITLRLQARDDTGKYLESWTDSPDAKSVPSVILSALHSLQVVAAEVTEEEGFEGKTKF